MTLTSELDIAASIEAIKAVDVEQSPYAYDLLHNHFKSRLVNYARRAGAADPEGAANLALFDTFRAIERLENQSVPTFSSYLFTALRSHIASDMRKERAVPLPVGGAPDVDRLATDFDDVEEQFIASHSLEGHLDELPDDQRLVLEMRFFQGLTGDEMAVRLERTPNAIHQLQHRALNNLRTIIAAAAATAIIVVVVAAYLAGADQQEIQMDPISPVHSGPSEDEDSRGEQETGGDDNAAERPGATLIVDNGLLRSDSNEPALDTEADARRSAELPNAPGPAPGPAPEPEPPATATTSPSTTTSPSATASTAATAPATTRPPSTTASPSTTEAEPPPATTTTTADKSLLAHVVETLDPFGRECSDMLLLWLLCG